MTEHDWWYEYSDDHRAWCRGFYDRREILKLFKKLSVHEREYFIGMIPESERLTFRAQLNKEIGNDESE